MIFEIYITEKQKKILKSLDKKIEGQIFKKIEQLIENPEIGKPLSNELSGCRSLHVGNYRIIYEIKSDKIYILTVGHRKHIYAYFNPDKNSEFTNVLRSPDIKIFYITAGKETNNKKFMKFIKEKLGEYETMEDIEYCKKIKKSLKKGRFISGDKLKKEFNLK